MTNPNHSGLFIQDPPELTALSSPVITDSIITGRVLSAAHVVVRALVPEFQGSIPRHSEGPCTTSYRYRDTGVYSFDIIAFRGKYTSLIFCIKVK